MLTSLLCGQQATFSHSESTQCYSMLSPIAAIFYTQQQSQELLSAIPPPGAGGLQVSLQHPALLNQASG